MSRHDRDRTKRTRRAQVHAPQFQTIGGPETAEENIRAKARQYYLDHAYPLIIDVRRDALKGGHPERVVFSGRRDVEPLKSLDAHVHGRERAEAMAREVVAEGLEPMIHMAVPPEVASWALDRLSPGMGALVARGAPGGHFMCVVIYAGACPVFYFPEPEVGDVAP